MSRYIKFRVWNTSSKEMLFNVNLPWDFKSESGDGIWQQFTGLHDRNGKEVFEGDLLMFGTDAYALYEVFYHDDEARFKCCRVHYTGSRCGGYIPEITSHLLTVHGNIYENVELINSNNPPHQQ